MTRDDFLRIKPGPMPGFRKLMKAGKLHDHTITLAMAASGNYRLEFAAVSHRWTKRGHPDNDGSQLLKLQEELRKRPSIQWIWVDWMCMPQNEGKHRKTPLEKDYFKLALSQVNLLYLFMHVFILYDADYARRFWCLLESYMATHRPTLDALEFERPHDTETRYDLIPMGSMEGEHEQLMAFLGSLNKDTATYLKKLSQPDIKVTNQSDKDTMIDKMQVFLPELQRKLGSDTWQEEQEPASPDILQELKRRKSSNSIIVPETIGAATNSMQSSSSAGEIDRVSIEVPF
jgi:hypothetical protein